jgi:hypothetical protein
MGVGEQHSKQGFQRVFQKPFLHYLCSHVVTTQLFPPQVIIQELAVTTLHQQVEE